MSLKLTLAGITPWPKFSATLCRLRPGWIPPLGSLEDKLKSIPTRTADPSTVSFSKWAGILSTPQDLLVLDSR